MDIRTYSAILIVATVVSGVLAQNVPVTTLIPNEPNSTTVAPTPPPHCNLVKVRPNHTSERNRYQILSSSSKANEPKKVCLLAEFNAVILVNGTTAEYLDLGKGTVDDQSYCHQEEGKAMLVVNFVCGQIQLNIEGNQTVVVKPMHGFYHLGDPTKHIDFHFDDKLFETTKEGFYYRCDVEQSVGMDVSNAKDVNIALIFSNVGIEAFRDTNQTTFYRPPEICAAQVTPVNDLVPIAVGACLAALVVIVLIAYFVGRRRWSERSTYESV